MDKLLLKKKDEVGDYLLFLQEVGEKYSRDQFTNDPQIYSRSIRFLHVAVEYLLEAGGYIILMQDNIKFTGYDNLPAVMSENNIISPDLKDSLQSTVDFRNLLTDIYMNLDPGLIYDFLENISELRQIEDTIITLLEEGVRSDANQIEG
ncbi:MAG: DUF86 domain-containing protein [Halanaerobiaceae bacterium]